MPATGLLALLDDLATLLDDVALMTRVATRKTAGVIGDDLALNAEQVTGMRPERELPVIWAVARGALLNKVILVPTALLISAYLPWAITPLLLVGGIFLCYEGFAKVWAKLRPEPEEAVARAARAQAVASAEVDLVAFEKDRIRGAVRTDFILSAEIVVIALGTMADASLGVQAASLAAVGLGVTVLVYGPVSLLVKLDDIGLRMQDEAATTPGRAKVGGLLLALAPRIMRTLSILGTAAMFIVGGGIVVHAVPPLEHAAAGIAASAGFVGRTLADALVGVLVGGAVYGLKRLVRRAPA